MSTLPTDLFF